MNARHGFLPRLDLNFTRLFVSDQTKLGLYIPFFDGKWLYIRIIKDCIHHIYQTKKGCIYHFSTKNSMYKACINSWRIYWRTESPLKQFHQTVFGDQTLVYICYAEYCVINVPCIRLHQIFSSMLHLYTEKYFRNLVNPNQFLL